MLTRTMVIVPKDAWAALNGGGPEVGSLSAVYNKSGNRETANALRQCRDALNDLAPRP